MSFALLLKPSTVPLSIGMRTWLSVEHVVLVTTHHLGEATQGRESCVPRLPKLVFQIERFASRFVDCSRMVDHMVRFEVSTEGIHLCDEPDILP